MEAFQIGNERRQRVFTWRRAFFFFKLTFIVCATFTVALTLQIFRYVHK